MTPFHLGTVPLSLLTKHKAWHSDCPLYPDEVCIPDFSFWRRCREEGSGMPVQLSNKTLEDSGTWKELTHEQTCERLHRLGYHLVDDNDGSPMVADPQPAKAIGYHDVDEFYRDDDDTPKPIDPPLIGIQDVQALYDQTNKSNHDIDPHEFDLVKAMVNGYASSPSPYEVGSIVADARRILAELRDGKAGE